MASSSPVCSDSVSWTIATTDNGSFIDAIVVLVLLALVPVKVYWRS